MKAILILCLVVLWCLPLTSSRPLARPDEARYGEIAREMAVTGDYITPHLNGIQYLEKPPLQYWATAFAFKVFGVHEWTARLWPTLSGFFTVLFAGAIAFRLKRRALNTLLMTASAFYVALLGHINTLDAGLTAFMTAALWAFLVAKRSRHAATWMMIAGVMTGLAILSKGIVALVIPGFTMVLYSLIHRNLSAFRQTHLIHFLGATLLTAAPWFVLCALNNLGFLEFFFIHEHFERFTSHVHQRVEPFWYFIPLLLVGLLPWTLRLPGALWRTWRAAQHDSGFKVYRFIAVYALATVLFFSLSGSKLPTYIFPAFPALLILIGVDLEETPAPRLIGLSALALGSLLFIAGGLFQYPELGQGLHYQPDLDPDMVMPYAHLAPWLWAAGIVLVMAATVYVAKPRIGLSILGLASLLAADLSLFGASHLAQFNSIAPTLKAWQDQVHTDTRVFSVRTYEQSLPFYLGRTVTLVEFEDELGPGLKAQPELAIPSFDAFTKVWGQQTGDIAIMEPQTLDAFRSQHLPFRILAQDPRHVVVSAR